MKVCLVVLDGWGHNKEKTYKDAINDSNCKNIQKLSKKYVSYLLHASGRFVGLQEGSMGNSEVGHLTLGSGRIVEQNITLIDKEIKTNQIAEKLLPLSLLKRDIIHLVGLVSDGGIHSHINHLIAIIKLIHKNYKKVYVHCISDGRDTAPKNFMKYYENIVKSCASIDNCVIASIGGRFYGMDRDDNYDRTNAYFQALTNSKSIENLEVYINKQYEQGNSDENLYPVLLNKDGCITKKDIILFFNFRADRMRQITNKFIKEDFTLFTLTDYGNDLTNNILYRSNPVKNTLADVLETNKIEQIHIAETEKYAHVTYFFNGGNEKLHKYENRKIVNSKKMQNYADMPEMSSKETADEVISNLKQQKQFIVANFAAPDMVGHTGNYQAAMKAVEYIDEQIGRIYSECKKNDFVLIITADHGNAESMYEKNKHRISKTHTTNKVPFIITLPCETEKSYAKNEKWGYVDSEFSLADVAPTILDLFNIQIPAEFTGKIIDCKKLINNN